MLTLFVCVISCCGASQPPLPTSRRPSSSNCFLHPAVRASRERRKLVCRLCSPLTPFFAARRPDGACRFPSELHHSSTLLPHLLPTQPELCGEHASKSDEACDPTGAYYLDAPRFLLEDPGLCGFKARCVSATQFCETASPCSWGESPNACAAAAPLLRAVGTKDVTRKDLELVVVSSGEDVGWSDPLANVRTVVSGTSTGKEQVAYLRCGLPRIKHGRGSQEKSRCRPRDMHWLPCESQTHRDALRRAGSAYRLHAWSCACLWLGRGPRRP